ncbi:MAG TPA: phosphoribosyltransferase [Gammaproteobacteria bacterium]|jgi:predicted phosphoribosyltransferase|nr:phosphoribosyltransferase [Gammaproteobacteria bacterium]
MKQTIQQYQDRAEAGKILADALVAYQGRSDVIVLALARGGVPVGYEIAKALSVPLDVYIVRKLGVPGHEELAMGAVASGGITVFNESIVRDLHLSEQTMHAVIEAELKELKRREIRYRAGRPFPRLANKCIILVDDGIATGATIKVAIKALRQQKPSSIIVAVPVAPPEICKALEIQVEGLICPLQPSLFNAVGTWYQHFSQTEDEEVVRCLALTRM